MFTKFYPRERKEKTEDYQMVGESLYNQERFAEAEDAFRQELQEKDGPNSNTAENILNDATHSAHWLGASLIRQGKNSEAEELLLLVAEGLKNPEESEDTSVFSALRFLGEVLCLNKKYKEAKIYLQVALEGYERILGKDHTDTLTCIQWLASCYFKQARYIKAERHSRDAVTRRTKVLGRDHIHTLSSMHWLARCYFHQARYTEAEGYFRDTIERRERVLEKDDTETLNNLHWLARCCFEQTRYAKAEGYFQDLVEKEEKILGKDHIDTLNNLHWLARCCVGQAKYAKAESYFRNIMEREERALGKNDTETLLSVVCVADTYVQKGRYAEAERQLQDIPSRCEISFGEEHPDTLWCKEVLATAHYEQGNYNEAATSLRTIVRIRKKIMGKDDASTLRCERLLQRALLKKLPYTDKEILDISLELKHTSPHWSHVPRTYVLLRDIDCLHVLDGLIEEGFSDYMFPVTEISLPQFLRESQRSKIVEVQHLVMSQSSDLEKGKHCYFKKDELIPLETKQVLGSGGFGQVDKVLSLVSHREYARKQVRRSLVFSGNKKKDHMTQFVEEIAILKRLNHAHIVKFVGSYTSSKNMGLIMLPVAEMNLTTYLEREDDSKHGELRTFFGCLGKALEFLHEQGVRHKDIKPENILIHHGKVLLTDFGLSFDSKDAEGSTTTSMVVAWTRRYGAPEVAFHEPRNTRSDIWSLGVVFLEMIVVLKGESIEGMDRYFEAHGSRKRFAFSNLTAVFEFIAELKHTENQSDNVALAWVEQMLQEDPLQRPTATQLMDSIMGGGQGDGRSAFCGICCSPLEDSGNDSDDDDEEDTYLGRRY